MSESSLRSDRWQPVRGGLINLFKYQDQVFRYERGHLLLRGDNGSGKSRVLALQLPFLLDGELRPDRVEPDRDPAKRMEWNLLMERHERRVGYTWIEFGRLNEGKPRYLTLGCGLDARKGGGSPNRWFFISPRRVGEDLQLIRNKAPLNRRQLAEHLRELGDGKLHDKLADYRSAVDAALFKLGNRYRPLIDLLIQLCQPQLMRDMKENVLSNALSEALAPVSEALIEQAAESFQGLETDRQRTEEYRETLESVDSFRDGYVQYLSTAIRRLCEVVRQTHSQFENTTKALRKLEHELDGNRLQLASAGQTFAQKKDALAACDAEIQTLRDSPEMRSKRDLERAIHRAEENERDAESAQEDLGQAEAERQRADRDQAGHTEVRDAKCVQLTRMDAGLKKAHTEIAAQLDAYLSWQESEPTDHQAAVEAMIQQRRRGVRQLEKRNQEITSAQAKRDQARDRVEQQRSSTEEASEAVDQSLAGVQQALEHFDREARHWEQELVELRPEIFPRDEAWLELLGAWLEERSERSPFETRLQKARGRRRNAAPGDPCKPPATGDACPDRSRHSASQPGGRCGAIVAEPQSGRRPVAETGI